MSSSSEPGDPAPPGKSPWIIDTTAETFARDVIERSRESPVVVDFWAPWCQPCRLLGPVLEKLAVEYNGRFLLVKADTERLPAIAAQFGVQSIPMVVALRDAQIIDQFVGLLDEAQIRQFLDRIQPSPAEQLLASARELESVDPAASEARYREALAHAPNDSAAKIGLARVLLSQGKTAASQQLVEELAQRGFLEPKAEQLQARLALLRQGTEAGSLEQARTAATQAPDDLPAQWTLAQALAAAEEYEQALEICLQLVQRDRKGLGEEARQMMVHVFHLLGHDSELATAYRRKLSAALY